VFLTTDCVNLSSYWVKVLSTIDICSYSIYLIHFPFFKLLNYVDFFPKYLLLLFPLKILLIFIIVFIISSVLYYLIELPSIKFGKKLRAREKKGAL